MTETAQGLVLIEWNGEAVKASIGLPGIGILNFQKYGKERWYIQTLDLAGVTEGQDSIAEFREAETAEGYPPLVDSQLRQALEAALDATPFAADDCDCPDHTCSSLREHAELVHTYVKAAAIPDYL